MNRFFMYTVMTVSLLALGCGGGKRSATNASGSKRVVIQNKGSDTLVNVAQAWAENYAKIESNVAIAVTGGGSGTGISSMINGTVDIANSSRRMKAKEIALAEKNGVTPVEHIVGYDAIAVFLHKNNPMNEVSTAQLKAVYGEGSTVEKWSQLGVTVPGCPSDEIIRISRQNNSGTYAYFKKAILGKKGEYKLGSRDMHGSKDVVELVEKTACAIGYSGLAYTNDHVKMPCVKQEDGGTCVHPTPQTASDNTYPIARPLLMYTSGEPKGVIKAYMDWIMSDTGQCIISKKGYAPIREMACK